MSEPSREAKMDYLRQLRHRLSLDEKMLDYYCNSVKPEEVTFAMKVADKVNRMEYENTKAKIAELEKDLGIFSKDKN